MKGTVGIDKEGDMEQMILVVLAIVALCWGLCATPWKTVKARVRVAQGVSLRRLRKRL
jgi:hypothetical protein